MKPEEAIEILSNELIVVGSVIGFYKDFEGLSENILETRIKRRDAIRLAIEAMKELPKTRNAGRACKRKEIY